MMAAQVQVTHQASRVVRLIQIQAIVWQVSGVLLMLFQQSLDRLVGIPAWMLLALGAIFLVEGTIGWWFARRPEYTNQLATAVIRYNLITVLFVAILPLTNLLPLTTYGLWLLLDIGIVSALFGLFQWRAHRV